MSCVSLCCPVCSAAVLVPFHYRGRTTLCRGCGRNILVPHDAVQPEAPEPAAAPAPVADQSRPAEGT